MAGPAPQDRRTLRYGFWSLAPPAALAFALGAAVSAQAILLALLASIPWLAWRYDNASGAFFPLSLLFLLVLAVPALLLALLAVTH